MILVAEVLLPVGENGFHHIPSIHPSILLFSHMRRAKKYHPERMKQILRTRRCLIICDSASTLTPIWKIQDFCHQLQGIRNPTRIGFMLLDKMWVRTKSPKPALHMGITISVIVGGVISTAVLCLAFRSLQFTVK